MAAGDLTTSASVREYLRIPTAQTDMNALLATFITQASTAIKRYTAREFAPATAAGVERAFKYAGGGIVHLAPYDCVAVTQVEVDTDTDSPTVLDSDSYRLLPVGKPSGAYNAIELRGVTVASRTSDTLTKPWREVSVTGTWGFTAVPDDVALAANMLVAWYYRNHSAPPSVELGDEGDRRFGPVLMPSGVRALLDHWRVVSFGHGA